MIRFLSFWLIVLSVYCILTSFFYYFFFPFVCCESSHLSSLWGIFWYLSDLNVESEAKPILLSTRFCRELFSNRLILSISLSLWILVSLRIRRVSCATESPSRIYWILHICTADSLLLCVFHFRAFGIFFYFQQLVQNCLVVSICRFGKNNKHWFKNMLPGDVALGIVVKVSGQTLHTSGSPQKTPQTSPVAPARRLCEDDSSCILFRPWIEWKTKPHTNMPVHMPKPTTVPKSQQTWSTVVFGLWRTSRPSQKF